MRSEERIQNELKRNLEYLEEFKMELKALLDEDITDYQDWNESITRKGALISEAATKLDTLKMVLK